MQTVVFKMKHLVACLGLTLAVTQASAQEKATQSIP